MQAIYINYPNTYISVHEKVFDCPHHNGRDHIRNRELKTSLDIETLVRDIERKEIPFTSKAGLNGLWVYVDRDACGIAIEIKASMDKTYTKKSPFEKRECSACRI